MSTRNIFMLKITKVPRKDLFYRMLLLCLLSLFGSVGILHAEETPQEYKLKAAFLVNFARFITWPESSFPAKEQDLVFCVLGKTPFTTTLKSAETIQINGHKTRVISMDTWTDISQCHMVFVGQAAKGKLGKLIAEIGKQAVVTVSDIPDFIAAGGAIEFVTKEDRLSFNINYSELKAHGIQVSASMLDLAGSVQ